MPSLQIRQMDELNLIFHFLITLYSKVSLIWPGRWRGGRRAAEGARAFPCCPPQAGPSSSSGPGARTAAGGGGGGPCPRHPPPSAITAREATGSRRGRPVPLRRCPLGIIPQGQARLPPLSSPPPSRLYPRTIDPAFLPHIRGLYAEPAEASRLPARERIAPARPHSLPASAPASPLSPPGSGGRPLGMAAPNQSLPPPPGARTHTRTHHTHTHSWQRRRGDEGAGTSGRARPYTRARGAGAGALGRASGAAGNSQQGRPGGRGAHGGRGAVAAAPGAHAPAVPGWGELGTSGCGSGRGPLGALVEQAAEWERGRRGLAPWLCLPPAPPT